MKKNKEKLNFIGAIKWMYSFGKDYKRWLYGGIVTSMTLIITNILKAHYTQEIVNNALGGEFNKLIKIIIIFSIIIGVGIISEYLTKFSIGNYALYTTKKIKDNLAHHLTVITMKESNKFSSGDLASRLNNDTQHVTNVLKNDFVNIGVQPFMAIVALGYILTLNFKLAIVSIVSIPILMFIAKMLNNKMGKLFSKNYEYLGEASSFVEESIIGIDVLKTYNLEETFHSKAKKVYGKNFKTEVKVYKYLAPMQAVGLSLAWSPRLICALYGGHMAFNGEISVGTLVAVIQLLDYLAYPTAGFSFILSSVNRAISAISRIEEITKLSQEPRRGDVLVPNRKDDPIRFRDVSFEYEDSKKVLENIDLVLPQGKMIALVGASGSGKSTIIDLISGFYQGYEGDIRLYGKNIKDLNLRSIRENIAVISQDTYLFPGTIADNILYGNKDASMEDVIRSSKASYSHDFIMDLKEGYNTKLGEGGINLSGGQKQRISMARGFLKDAPILLLDEPTASLDNYSESIIQNSLDNLTENKSVLVIAHRLSTILKADKIIVLNEGRIVESGTHDELINKGRYYFTLYNNQYLKEDKKVKGEVSYV